MKSLIQEKKECYFCGTTYNLHKHHIFYGTSNRKNSEKYGCWCWLCAGHHNMSNESVHMNRDMDEYLKVFTQKQYEKNHSREEFRQIFGKSWI